MITTLELRAMESNKGRIISIYVPSNESEEPSIISFDNIENNIVGWWCDLLTSRGTKSKTAAALQGTY